MLKSAGILSLYSFPLQLLFILLFTACSAKPAKPERILSEVFTIPPSLVLVFDPEDSHQIYLKRRLT